MNYIAAVFLLILAVCGNFVAETLGCQMQRLLTNNMYAKHLIIIALVYFTINFTGTKDTNPNEHLKQTMIIYALFIIYSKTNIYFSSIGFLLLISNYVLQTYITYYETIKDTENLENLNKYKNITMYAFIIITLMGFTQYAIYQYSERHGNFNPITFLFGKIKCDNN
tara:strand:+ start:1026 stop:1526 length:501 start_codon:yes stop_codon:yes gene_type:complete